MLIDGRNWDRKQYNVNQKDKEGLGCGFGRVLGGDQVGEAGRRCTPVWNLELGLLARGRGGNVSLVIGWRVTITSLLPRL